MKMRRALQQRQPHPAADRGQPHRGGPVGQHGQATVEFALAFTVFAFVLMGIFDFGRGVAAYGAIANAAREGARLAMHHPSEFNAGKDANIRAEVRARAGMLVGLTDADIVITPSEDSRTYGNLVTVTVNYTFNAVTPVIAAFLPSGGLPLIATSESFVQ